MEKIMQENDEKLTDETGLEKCGKFFLQEYLCRGNAEKDTIKNLIWVKI